MTFAQRVAGIYQTLFTALDNAVIPDDIFGIELSWLELILGMWVLTMVIMFVRRLMR